MSQNINPSVSFSSSTLIIFFTNIAWWWYVFWLALKLLDYLLSFAFKPNNLSLAFNQLLFHCRRERCFVIDLLFSNKKWTAFDLATVLIVRVLLLSLILIHPFEGIILLSYVLVSTNENSQQKEVIVTDQCCSQHLRCNIIKSECWRRGNLKTFKML